MGPIYLPDLEVPCEESDTAGCSTTCPEKDVRELLALSCTVHIRYHCLVNFILFEDIPFALEGNAVSKDAPNWRR